ncbi:MAG: 4-deoxy-4-formamido-L-arabinose-phosphoundecaprenol deformylase ArnD [Candidatus Brocadia sinica]|nr:MAG: 4-deoxy-4-formamido-L-arabinose-phosphoundecaprenol deformylase ArnD [Candidatus Brocadia sinica]
MTKIDELLYVAISLDIDPDANSAVEGRHDALSSPTEHGKVTIGACKRGLQKILELLDIYDIDATLFYEARTAQMLVADGMNLPKLSERHEVSCHSLKHEDFLGKVSGMPMEEESIEKAITKAKDILENIFERDIKGFRAPYTRINRTVIKVLEWQGFLYDSSETVTMGTEWTGDPFPLEIFDSNLLELALPSFHDTKGKRMSSYLWAIFEGRRVSSDYIDAVLSARDVANGGLFIFSIHPWHLYADCQGNPFTMEQIKKNLENLESILSQLKQMQGIQLTRQDKYLKNWLVK